MNLRFLWRILERYVGGHRAALMDLTEDYDRASATYDQVWPAFMAPVNEEALSALKGFHLKHVLDLGCGTGEVARWLLAHGFEGDYVGIDASRCMLKELPSSTKGIHGDVHELLPRFPEASFDAVCALWSWEYVDRCRLLPHIRRVLRPGGRVVLLANRRDTLPEMERAFLRLMARHPEAIRKVFHLALRMPRGASQMARELRRNGFCGVKTWQGEKQKRHAHSGDAVTWVFEAGALAGTRCVLELPELEVRLAEVLGDTCLTTHRYVAGIGDRPC